MTVSELEETYQQLHEQLLRGELDEEEFKAQVDPLRLKDDQGTEWKIGWYTGKWYRYDEGQWARVLQYDRPVGLSLAVVRAVRDSSAELLDTLVPADLSRQGLHTESGTYSLADWLDTYIAHARDHATQIRSALA